MRKTHEQPGCLYWFSFVYEIANFILQTTVMLHSAFTEQPTPYFWVKLSSIFREYQNLLIVVMVHLIIVILLRIRFSLSAALLMVIAAIVSFFYLSLQDWGDAGIWMILFIPTWVIFPFILGLPLLISELRKR